MLHVEKTPPVAAHLFGHLTSTPTSTRARFGNSVNSVDDDEWETASMSAEAAVGTIAAPPSTAMMARPFAKTEDIKSIRDWLVGGLGAKRGVLSAWPFATGLKPSPADRVLLLSQSIASGHSWWWLHKFKNTLFSRRDSYKPRPNAVVYRVGGEPATGWNWFPRGTLYGMDPGVVDVFLHFGLCVTVWHLPAHALAPSLDAQVSYCAISVYLELEAAAIGVAPPVFASMLVFDKDDYLTAERALEVDATVPFPHAQNVVREASSNVLGTVTASQLHTFRLSDMLRAYNELRPIDNRLLMQKQIQDATVELVGKIQRLAGIKILKLNICASNVVFCPHLGESTQSDEWVLSGFGFKTDDTEFIAGKPHLTEYDPRMCKRMAGQAEYDTNCAFVLMVAILLASVRAEFGGVATLMLRAILNQDPEGMPKSGTQVTPLALAFSTASSKADVFRDVVLRSFQHSRLERDPVPSTVFDEVVADFADTLAQPVTVLGYQPQAGQPPRFHQLVLRLVESRSYTPCDVAAGDDIAADQAQARKHRSYVTRVIRERQDRIRARGSPPTRSVP